MTVQSFYTTVLMKDIRFHSTTPIRDVSLLEPATRDAVMKIITNAGQAGIHFQVLETFRSQELQQLYFEKGVTQLRTVGVHHYGLACDLGIVVAGQVQWKADYSVLGRYAKMFNLVWGGDWGNPAITHSFQDDDHVQRIAVADQDKLFDGSWYPDPSYVAPGVG
jgi:hypothetical protein